MITIRHTALIYCACIRTTFLLCCQGEETSNNKETEKQGVHFVLTYGSTAITTRRVGNFWGLSDKWERTIRNKSV